MSNENGTKIVLWESNFICFVKICHRRVTILRDLGDSALEEQRKSPANPAVTIFYGMKLYLLSVDVRVRKKKSTSTEVGGGYFYFGTLHHLIPSGISMFAAQNL